MKIRYPVSFFATVVLAMSVAGLTVVWNAIHLFGLMVVLAMLFVLPALARWEGRYASWVSHKP